MLGELVEVALDMAESCAPCSGNEPSDAVWPGSATAGAAAGTPGSNPPASNKPHDPSADQPSEREGSDKKRSDRESERDLQRKNAKKTVKDLAWEWFTSPAGGLGKVTGPLGTVAAGAEPLAEGVANVLEADVIREDRIYRDTGGQMGKPRPDSQGAGGKSNAPAADAGSGSGDNAAQSEADAQAQAKYERTMEEIRSRAEARHARERGNSSWKDWR